MIPTFFKVIANDFGLQFADFEFIHYDLEVFHVAHIFHQLVELFHLGGREFVATQQALQQLLQRVPLAVRRLHRLHIHGWFRVPVIVGQSMWFPLMLNTLNTLAH